ncbi:hypothetical protein Tco_1199681 [Tanacetum coccineum]
MRLLEASLSREIRDCVLISIEKQKNEILMLEKKKISSDSKDVQANLLKRIKILENEFKRSQAQSINFKLKSQHKKEKMACDVSWKVKRALFTSPVASKSRNLGATFLVAKSRFSVAKTQTATNKVSSASSLSPESSQSRTLSNYMKNKIATRRKWGKWFENQPSFNWSSKSKTTQLTPSVSKSSASLRTNSKTPVITQKWVAKLSTLPSMFVSCDADDPAHPLDC